MLPLGAQVPGINAPPAVPAVPDAPVPLPFPPGSPVPGTPTEDQSPAPAPDPAVNPPATAEPATVEARLENSTLSMGEDTGAKMIHAADETTSNIVAKSISVGQGRSTYRGVVHIPKHLKGCKNNTECDALLINTNSRTDTYPAITVRGDRNYVQHEASVSKVNEEMIFYMQQRGLTEGQAMSLAVNGFINDLARQFPMEYSVELKRLIDLEMEGSVG